MTIVTPAVCLQGSGSRPGEATERSKSTRENDTLSGLRGPQHRAKTGAREGSRKRPAGRATQHSLRPPFSRPKWEGDQRWGQSGRGRRLGGDRSLGLRSLPQLGPRGRRLGSQAAGGHFSCGAAETPAAFHVPKPSPSLVPPPLGVAPRREPGGAGEASGPAANQDSGPPGGGRDGGVVSAGSGRRTEQGERGERAGSRYLYWAAAAAAAAPLWVNPK